MKYYETLHDCNEENLPLNCPIWALAYNINNDTLDRRLICKPVLGILEKNGYGTIFFTPFKKGTTEKRKSGIVNSYNRIYADTYEEAVEMYNRLVQERIDRLKNMLEDARKDMIIL